MCGMESSGVTMKIVYNTIVAMDDTWVHVTMA